MDCLTHMQTLLPLLSCCLHGRSQDFIKGDHTESYIGYLPDCHLNIVGCLLTKRLTKGGGGVTGTPRPPWLRPWFAERVLVQNVLDENGLFSCK